jgi:hypothetical protein
MKGKQRMTNGSSREVVILGFADRAARDRRSAALRRRHRRRHEARARHAAEDGDRRCGRGPLRLARVQLRRARRAKNAIDIFKLAMRDYPDLVKRNSAALVERLRAKLSEELAATEEASDENSMRLSESDVPTPEEAGRLIAGATPGLFRTCLMTAALTGTRSEEPRRPRGIDPEQGRRGEDHDPPGAHLGENAKGQGSSERAAVLLAEDEGWSPRHSDSA